MMQLAQTNQYTTSLSWETGFHSGHANVVLNRMMCPSYASRDCWHYP